VPDIIETHNYISPPCAELNELLTLAFEILHLMRKQVKILRPVRKQAKNIEAQLIAHFNY